MREESRSWSAGISQLVLLASSRVADIVANDLRQRGWQHVFAVIPEGETAPNAWRTFAPEDPMSPESIALLRGAGPCRFFLDLGEESDWYDTARAALARAFQKADRLYLGGLAGPAFRAAREAVASGRAAARIPLCWKDRASELTRRFHPGTDVSELFLHAVADAVTHARNGAFESVNDAPDGVRAEPSRRFDPELSATTLERLTRAHAGPLGDGLASCCRQVAFSILEARFALWQGDPDASPGALDVRAAQLLVRCGKDALRLDEVSIDGLRLRGGALAHRLGWTAGDRLETHARAAAPARKANDFIAFGVPDIGAAERSAVDATLASRWIGTGPEVARFEREFAEAVGAPLAVAVSSCTAALHLALLSHGIGPGDEVITTPMSFVATANAVLYTGATPVFADVSEDSLNVDPIAVAAQVTSRTRAILPVHFGGTPCDIAGLSEVASAHGLPIIEDAAHAIGSRFVDGVAVGGGAHDACFSFYPNKNITSCEGGMFATRDSERAELVRSLRLHGLSTDAWKRFGSRKLLRSRMQRLGFKYNMTDLQAALGRAQLARLEAFTDLRNHQALRYRRELRACRHFAPLTAPEGRSAYHLFTVRVRGLDRDAVIERFRGEGIGASIHYHPIHQQPYYRERFPDREGRYPIAERAGAETLSLPIGPSVSPADQDRIIRAVREIDRAGVGNTREIDRAGVGNTREIDRAGVGNTREFDRAGVGAFRQTAPSPIRGLSDGVRRRGP